MRREAGCKRREHKPQRNLMQRHRNRDKIGRKEKNMVTSEIRSIAKRLEETVKPQGIYLFGSFVRTVSATCMMAFPINFASGEDIIQVC